MVRELSAGEAMLSAHDLASERGRVIEARDLKLAQVESELARVTNDCSEKTARLRALESAWSALMDEVEATVDTLGVPKQGGLVDRLEWLREQRAPAYEQLRQVDTLLMHYMPATNAPTHLVARLEYVLTMLQQGKGGAA